LLEVVTITPRDNSSNKVTGPVRIIDAEGAVIREVPEGEVVLLCRCGHSEEKPFCDSSHKKVGFESVVRASDFPL
jgi:CDGSH iron-sulfur domain-containing protein 3